MAYDEKIADCIRESLVNETDVDPIKMFGGVCFMVNEKMCVGVIKNDMMCRIGPDAEIDTLEQTGCRPMDFAKRPMKGYVYIEYDGMKTKKSFDHWISLCLDFNAEAKASIRKKSNGC